MPYYGWRPDLPDIHDLYRPLRASLALPVDLRPMFPPCYDQGQLGSCSANAAAGAMEYEQRRQGLPQFMPSRLFIYYQERSLEGTIPWDAGATIRDSIRALNRWGAPPETDWPYDITKFADQPPTAAYVAGLLDTAVKYERVAQDLAGIRETLQSKLCINFGFTVYESFESDEVAQTGIVPIPASGEATVGGHAVLIVGDIPSENRFIVRNSWGTSWGMDGYCVFPYDYLLNEDLAADFWAVQLIGKAP